MTPLCYAHPTAILAGHYHGAVIEVSSESDPERGLTAPIYSQYQLDAAIEMARAEGIAYSAEYRRLCAQLIVSEPA